VKIMQIIKIQSGDISSMVKEFDSHIVYYFDSLKFGKGYVNIDMDSVNEAFFFNDGKCLHIYREDGVKGVLYVEEDEGEIILEEQILEDRILREPLRALIVKKYIEYDEDGQAFISRTLPSMLI
jgi:hypothetical protein